MPYPHLLPAPGRGRQEWIRQEPRTISVFKYWARSWNVQESCWPSVPQVRVAEVSGGERRKIPERAAGSEKRLFFFLPFLILKARAAIWLYWGLIWLSVAKVCPLRKQLGDQEGAEASGTFGQLSKALAHTPLGDGILRRGKGRFVDPSGMMGSW